MYCLFFHIMKQYVSCSNVCFSHNEIVVKNIQFSSSATDFILSTKLAQNDGVIATRNYRLRAGCYDDKVAWRNVLEYQVNACVSPRKIWSISV